MFSSGTQYFKKSYKDSLINILATKEFVVNFATSMTRDVMNLSSIDSPSDIDEFVYTNIKKRKSKLVKAPSVFESPVNLECKLLKTLKLKSTSTFSSTLVIGEVVGIYINNKFIKEGRINSVAMRYVARMGHSDYTTVATKFRMKRANRK